MLKGFRKRAGLPAPGKDLGGWYSSDTFLVFGQIVSGLARLYAGTSDTPCAKKANRLIAEWAKCIEKDGYFYASRQPNAPHYVYDKMLWGLLDTYLYCSNQQSAVCMSRITDWAIDNLRRGGVVNEGTEWYTLSENLYRAYLATGDTKYKDFAQVWEYHNYWDIYAKGGDIFAPQADGSRPFIYHAYSHVNTLGGAAAAFLVKGDEEYLRTAVNGADYLLREQCYATGGYGPQEALLPRDSMLQVTWNSHKSFETQCGSWAAFKLCKYLLSLTGEASYGDWIERLVFNGIGASLPTTADGRVFYYSDYCILGGQKGNLDVGWTCCSGTRPQAVADYRDLIYFHDSQDLYVNLFTPSTVRWSRPSGSIILSQTTSFPESDQVRLTLVVGSPATFGIKLRVPGWLAQPMKVTINGGPATFQMDGKHWAKLSRRWKTGDQINVQLPMGLWASALDPVKHTPAAALFGPVVLAFEAPTARALHGIDVTAFDKALAPAKGKKLFFNVVSNPAIHARPYYSFGAGEKSYLYLDPSIGMIISYRDVQFTGSWGDSGVSRYSDQVGASAECSFEGTGIRWLGQRFDDAGVAEVTIDGQLVATVYQYGPERGLPFDWSYKGLAPKAHTIRLTLLPDIPQNSKGRFLNLSGFEILD